MPDQRRHPPADPPARRPSLVLVLLFFLAIGVLTIVGVLGATEIMRRQVGSETPISEPSEVAVADGLPRNVWLNFLAENCAGDDCFRDAHWMDPADPTRGAGGWVAHRPFHVREGFVTPADGAPMEGFDVRLTVTLRDEEGGAVRAFPKDRGIVDPTDYVVVGRTDRCGPGYAQQEGQAACTWFVHDFPAGLPEGRYDIKAEWFAPCWAWLELGFIDDCPDPDAIATMFDSFVNASFAGAPTDDPIANAERVWTGRAGVDQTSEPR